MHPIQDLFLESFSYVLQFDMHFYMHFYVDKNFILVKSGCYKTLGLTAFVPGQIPLKAGYVGIIEWRESINPHGRP
jgi:hypothetical protein